MQTKQEILKELTLLINEEVREFEEFKERVKYYARNNINRTFFEPGSNKSRDEKIKKLAHSLMQLCK